MYIVGVKGGGKGSGEKGGEEGGEEGGIIGDGGGDVVLDNCTITISKYNSLIF